MERRCKGTRANGKRCQSTAVDADGWCFAHSPKNTPADRKAARARGGKISATAVCAVKAIPADLAGVREGLLEAFGEVRDGTMVAGTANALAVLARAIVNVYEAGEYESRIAALEDQLANRKRA